jgi:5'-3' exonuclease
MWQSVSDNTFIFSKSGKDNKKLITPGNINSSFLKRECQIDDSYFPFIKAIWGDKGDDVIGVSGVGPAGIIEMFPELQSLIGTMEDLYENIQNKLPIFNVIPSKIENKKLKSVIDAEIDEGLISKNIKLVSFEMISRAIDDPTEIKMYERKNHLKKTLNEKRVINLDVVKETLDKFHVILEEESLDTIYHL